MNEIEKEILKNFGGVATEITFLNPKKVLRQADGKDELIENVTEINITKASDITSIGIRYKTEEGEGEVSTAIQNIEKIVVMD